MNERMNTYMQRYTVPLAIQLHTRTLAIHTHIHICTIVRTICIGIHNDGVFFGGYNILSSLL